jgi:integrase
MSQRAGQNGGVEVRHGSWRGRYLIDVPGQFARVKRSIILGPAKEMTKSEARRRLKEIIATAGINSPTYQIPSVLTFDRHAEEWEENYITRMKPSNQALLRYVLKRYLLPKWGEIAIDSITAEKVNQWLGEPTFKHLSPVTVRGVVRTLQLALGTRFGRRVIHYPARVNEEHETRCFAATEVSSILVAAPGQYKTLFTLAAETGMRAGELYGLRVEDVDFARNIVHVRRSMWNGQAQTPKTSNAYRAIDVQPYVTEMLKQHLAGRTAGLVFLSKRGTPLRNCLVLNKHLHPLLRKIGVARGGMHAFRHFRVSFLVQNETPFEVIKRWIGHGSEQMIRHYTHLHPTYRKEVMARIPAVIAPFAPQVAATV